MNMAAAAFEPATLSIWSRVMPILSHMMISLEAAFDNKVEELHADIFLSYLRDTFSTTALAGNRVHPRMVWPFPRDNVPENWRSMVPAATVNAQGMPLWRVPMRGPEFPAEEDTKTPCSMAANEPMATGSVYKGKPPKPKEMEITSTPSDIAWSKAASTSEE
uniref:Uncharacterized protein n=1 Tax=Opuntia streptacantha TaxID=393608 RepID=A0A7C9EWU4_OPUST